MPRSPQPHTFGYNAEATDFDTGMQYLRARYYDATAGHFFQEDDYRGRYTYPVSMNRYAYTYNNPVAYIDPSGYDTEAFYMEANGVKYYSYADLEYATDIAKFNFNIFNSDYTIANRKVNGDNGQLGSRQVYLDAFNEYHQKWESTWIKTSKKVNELYEEQYAKWEIYKADYAELLRVEEAKEPYWQTYYELNVALENWNTKQEEYNQKIQEELNSSELPPRMSEDEILAAWRNRGSEYKNMTYSEFWWMLSESYYISPIPDGYEYEVEKGDLFGAGRGDHVHAGSDFGVDAGTPVVAMESGEVIKIHDGFFYNTDAVVIVGETGCTIIYGEVTPAVKAGDIVEQGQIIAHVKTSIDSEGTARTMAHIEIYTGFYKNLPLFYDYAYDMKDYKYVPDDAYGSRLDLLDSSGIYNLTKIRLAR